VVIYSLFWVVSYTDGLGKINQTADYQGAIAATAANPLGKFLLIIVLVGLVIYVLWALAAAIFDLLHVGHDLKGLFKRAVLFINAVIYGLLIPMLVVYISGGSTQTGSQNFSISKLASTIFLLPFWQMAGSCHRDSAFYWGSDYAFFRLSQ